MKPSIEREQRLYDALKRITKYMPPDKLRKRATKDYSLTAEEAIEYAYENVLQEARDAIKGMKRPVPAHPAERLTDGECSDTSSLTFGQDTLPETRGHSPSYHSREVE